MPRARERGDELRELLGGAPVQKDHARTESRETRGGRAPDRTESPGDHRDAPVESGLRTEGNVAHGKGAFGMRRVPGRITKEYSSRTPPSAWRSKLPLNAGVTPNTTSASMQLSSLANTCVMSVR